MPQQKTKKRRLSSRLYQIARQVALSLCSADTEREFKDALLLGFTELSILTDVKMPTVEATPESLEAVRCAYIEMLRIVITQSCDELGRTDEEGRSITTERDPPDIINLSVRVIEYIHRGLIGGLWKVSSCRHWFLLARDTRLAIEKYGQAAVTAADKERQEMHMEAWREIWDTFVERPLSDFIKRKQFRIVWRPKFNS
jgi:hypothetical protein